jgi:hydroxymethylpyrimidine kinase/phosphomethylpyrimidine kinase/thiamine-phosphate diphosphorylase
MIAKGGATLMDRDAIHVFSQQLLSQAYLLTPNVPEAERLLGKLIRSEAEMEEAARELYGMGAANVLIKGGHLTGKLSSDVLFDGSECHYFSAERMFTSNTHGTGCSYASAIAAFLAQGDPLRSAVEKAKVFITTAIRLARPLGKGHSPVNHYLAALEKL